MKRSFLICATTLLASLPSLFAQGVSKDAEHPAKSAFQASATLFLGGNEQNVTTVPATKRLVIEHVSMDCVTAPGFQIHTVKMKTTAGGHTAEHRLIAHPQGPGPGFAHFAVSQPVRVYADSATTVKISGLSNHSQAGGQCNAVISGHTVTILEFNGVPRL